MVLFFFYGSSRITTSEGKKPHRILYLAFLKTSKQISNMKITFKSKSFLCDFRPPDKNQSLNLNSFVF